MGREHLRNQGTECSIDERNEDNGVKFKPAWKKIIEYPEEEDWSLYQMENEMRAFAFNTKESDPLIRVSE